LPKFGNKFRGAVFFLGHMVYLCGYWSDHRDWWTAYSSSFVMHFVPFSALTL